jgi:hypothetical protein
MLVFHRVFHVDANMQMCSQGVTCVQSSGLYDMCSAGKSAGHEE